MIRYNVQADYFSVERYELAFVIADITDSNQSVKPARALKIRPSTHTHNQIEVAKMIIF